MNKHQKSLDDLFIYATQDSNCEQSVSDSTLERLKEDKNNIQKLVDKATPKKPEWGRTELGCGNCDSTRIIEIITERKNKFCPDCGVEIDWTKTSLIGEGEQK